MTAAGTILAVANIFLFLTGATAVTMIIVGGLRYAISGGDQGAITSAKNTIIYAILAIIFAFFAYALINFVLASLIVNETPFPKERFAAASRWGIGISVALSLGLAALRRESRVYRGIVYGTAWIVARYYPAGDRLEFLDRIYGTILQAGRWERWYYLYDIILYGPALGLRKRTRAAPVESGYRQ